jgi:hypothetical protein
MNELRNYGFEPVGWFDHNVRLRDLPAALRDAAPGIYALVFRHTEIEYVGSSTSDDIGAVRAHGDPSAAKKNDWLRAALQAGRRVDIWICRRLTALYNGLEIDITLSLEQHLIERLRPTHNERHLPLGRLRRSGAPADAFAIGLEAGPLR